MWARTHDLSSLTFSRFHLEGHRDGFLPPGLVEVYAGTMATHVEEPGPCLGLLVVPWLDRGIQFTNCAYRLPGLPFVSWAISLRHI